MRKIEEVSDLPQDSVDERKEMWRHEMQQVEQRRNDLLPKHQQMLKMSQKLQILQDKNCSVKRTSAGGRRKMKSSELRRRRRMQNWKTMVQQFRPHRWSKRSWTWKSEHCRQEDVEQRKSASRENGPSVPGDRNEGFPAGSVFDASALPTNGSGEGNGVEFNSPRDGDECGGRPAKNSVTSTAATVTAVAR